MSVKFIDSSKTTSEIKDGVTWYNNPALDVSVLSDGRVFNKRTGKFLKKTTQGTYSVYYTDGPGNSNPTTFDSLLSHMLGLKKQKGDIIKLNVKSLGYVITNITVERSKSAWKRSKSAKANQDLPHDVNRVDVDLHLLETSIVNVEGFDLRVFNTQHQFVTEDNHTFDTYDAALSHQNMVDKGKECAALIVEQKGGYVLAEQVYSLHVAAPRQYSNFAMMLENNSGIVEKGTNPTYKFKPTATMGEFKDLVIESEFTLEEATNVAKELNKYIDVTNKLLSLLVKN